MYWLNAGLQVELNLSQWQRHVVVLQEEFLLLRCTANFNESFNTWFRIKLKRDNMLSKVSTCVKGNLVYESLPGIWKWTKNGLGDYKRRFLERSKHNEDIVAARDCMVRVGACSWWDWKGGSRPFFLR